MSPRQITAPSASSGTAAMPALTELRETAGEIRIAHEFHLQALQRLLDLLGLMAGDDDHRLAFEASACSATIRTSVLPSSSASSLLGPPIRVERPAASTIAATLRLPSVSATVARLRPA